jgi:hypothetical protein
MRVAKQIGPAWRSEMHGESFTLCGNEGKCVETWGNEGTFELHDETCKWLVDSQGSNEGD